MPAHITSERSKLESIVKNYSYGLHDIVKNPDFKIQYHTKKRELEISGLAKCIDYKSGTCSQITYGLYEELKQTFPKLNIKKTIGNDDIYFTSDLDSHMFITEFNQKGISKRIIDGSFGYIDKYENRGYFARKFIHKDKKEDYDHTILKNGSVTPIAFTKDKKLIFVGPMSFPFTKKDPLETNKIFLATEFGVFLKYYTFNKLDKLNKILKNDKKIRDTLEFIKEKLSSNQNP